MALFNTALKKYSLQHGFDVVDVFNFTVGKEGFSNGLFHIDNHHLGAKALVEIEPTAFLNPPSPLPPEGLLRQSHRQPLHPVD